MTGPNPQLEVRVNASSTERRFWINTVSLDHVQAELSFIPDPHHWGLPFRRGLFTNPQHDFRTIVVQMMASDAVVD
jgi:hypothetical protein